MMNRLQKYSWKLACSNGSPAARRLVKRNVPRSRSNVIRRIVERLERHPDRYQS